MAPGRARTRSAHRGLLRGWASWQRPPNNHRRMRERRKVCAGKTCQSKSRSLPRPHPLADAHGAPRVDIARSLLDGASTSIPDRDGRSDLIESRL